MASTMLQRAETDEPQNIVAALVALAALTPNKQLYSFWSEDDHAIKPAWTAAALTQDTRMLAAKIQRVAPRGSRVAILLPHGADFILAFHACLAAGVIAVPIHLSRVSGSRNGHPHIVALLRDAEPAAVIADPATRAELESSLSAEFGTEVVWLHPGAKGAAGPWRDPGIRPDDIAFLQYTSGSTGQPRAACVSHGNIMHNTEQIRLRMRFDATTRLVSWLPFYHDMGLFSGVLMPARVGFETLLLAPRDFARRPMVWLEAMTAFRGTISGAPNFAYDLCAQRFGAEFAVGLDLSSWRVAFNGAEPIRADTLRRFAAAFASNGFSESAFYPCYGLAEASLMVSAATLGEGAVIRHFSTAQLEQGVAALPSAQEAAREMVSSGTVSGVRKPYINVVEIVDPETLEPLPDGRVGEIFVTGGSVTHGYWRQPAASADSFVHRDGADSYGLRTGDLGFVRDDQLFVSGRLKDVMKIRGRYLFPQDVERLVAETLAGVVPDCAAAFVAGDPLGDVLTVVTEANRRLCRSLLRDDAPALLDDLARQLRHATGELLGVELRRLVFIRPGGLPKTTSGKVRRRMCAHFLQDGGLPIIGDWPANDLTPLARDEHDPTAEGASVLDRLRAHWRSVLDEGPIPPDANFFESGGDSIKGGALVERINAEFGISLSLEEAFDADTIEVLARCVEDHLEACKP